MRAHRHPRSLQPKRNRQCRQNLRPQPQRPHSRLHLRPHPRRPRNRLHPRRISASSAPASPAADATAKSGSPAKSAKKAASTTAKAAAQPTPAAGSSGNVPSGTAVKKPATAVVAAPAESAATTAAAPSAVPPALGFIPPRKKLMLARSCRDDFRAYCPGVDVGAGRAITCLSENISKLTPVCRDTLAKLAR